MPRSTSVMRAIVWLTPVVLIATLAADFAVGGLALRATQRLETYHHAIEAVDQLKSDLTDAETGERGFLLTGDARYLGPYESGVMQIRRDLQQITSLAREGQLSSVEAADINRLAEAKIEELRETIALRQSKGLAAALPMVTTDYGKRLMDNIRTRLREVSVRLDNASAQAELEAENLEEYRTAVFFLAILINLGVLFWAYWLIRRESARREAVALELAQQRELLQVTLASVADGVIVTDLEGRVIFLNSAAEQLTGWKSAEVAGQPCEAVLKIIDEASRAPVATPIAKVLESGAIAGLASPTLLIRKDGRELPIDDSGAPIRDSNGAVRGAVLIFRDATAQREAFHRIEQANRALRAANETKDQFLATLSHELRTPLTPVLALLSAWSRDGAIPPMLRGDLGMLQRNIELEARLIDDLLDLTRIAKGKLTLHRQKLDLFEVINSAIEMYRPALEQAGLMIEVRFQARRHHVEADSARLHQIFGNIIGNAVKFTPRDGKITISVLDGPDRQAIAKIEDNGVGMTPEILARVFQPFEQGQTGANNRGGLGLGMSVAKRLAEMQGGTIAAASAGPDRGSTFTVALPTTAPEQQARSTSEASTNGAASPARRSGSILVVEDHEDTAEVMARLLINRGYRVVVSGSVSDALDKLDRGSFELLLSDIGLPDASGIELIRRVREHSTIPAIALTGFGSEVQVTEYQAAGFTTHLAKPVDFDQLDMTIQSLLGIALRDVN